MSDLDLANIQGFVVRGYRLPVAGYLFLRILDGPRAAAWLAGITEHVLNAAPWSEKPASGVNIAFTYAGLRAIGLADWSLAGFPQDFREGMAARAAALGDVGDSAPAHWEEGPGRSEVHVLVMISAQDRAALEAHDRVLRAEIDGSGGLAIVADQVGTALPRNAEHFGYADGFAQPSMEGSGVAPRPGQGAPTADGGWRPIRTGEFILGYRDEEDVLPAAPPPDRLAANGTYLVYRKLRQDVGAFRRQLARAAELYPGGEELLAAKIVGRWRDGTPIELSPERPDPELAADPRRSNAFHYGRDDHGLRCPIGSHVRRANPRDGLPFEGKLVNRHRMLRRGIPYGEPLPEGAPDDGADRGLLFTCLVSSITRQFEFVQSQWLNDGNVFGIGDDQDVLLGPHDNAPPHKMTVPGRPPFFLGPLERLVTVRGGEYFFVPGLNGLRFLAATAV